MSLDDDDDLKPVDDELTPVDDELAPVSDDQDDNETRDGFLLEQGGESGLTFKPNESAGTYGLSSGARPASESAEKYQNSSQSDAPRLESNVSPGDVYGIVTPEPTLESQSTTTTKPIKPSEAIKKNKDKKKAAFLSRKRSEGRSPSLDDDVSLETLRARRQRALMEEEIEKLRTERTPLPARPFWDDVAKPFLSPACVARLLMVAGAAFIPLLMATFFFSKALSHQIVADAQHSDVSALMAFFRCIWEDSRFHALLLPLGNLFRPDFVPNLHRHGKRRRRN